MDDPENLLLHSARNGDLSTVQRLLDKRRSGELSVDVNCKGEYSKASLS